MEAELSSETCSSDGISAKPHITAPAIYRMSDRRQSFEWLLSRRRDGSHDCSVAVVMQAPERSSRGQ